MKTFRLPTKVFEANLPDLIARLARVEGDDEVTVDFCHVEYWIPSAVVLLCSVCQRWRDAGRPVHFVNHAECPAFGYFQRIDFFERLGLHLEERFTRREPGTSFVTIEEIRPGVTRLNDELAQKLAGCVAGTFGTEDDAYRLSEYALGEIIANCKQHAGALGFASAQYVARNDWARIGIADSGMGILESFRRAGSRHYKEGMTHLEAIELALQPWVSSKRQLQGGGTYGGKVNFGVGLSMVSSMVATCRGETLIASGNAWWHRHREAAPRTGVLPQGLNMAGTLVSLKFSRGQMDGYQELLAETRRTLFLIPDVESSKFFT